LKKCPEAVKKHHNWAEGVERMSERGMAKSRLFNDVSSSRLGLDRAADDGESCCGAIAEKHHETEDQDIFQLEDTTPLSHSTANISRLPTVLPAEYLEDSRVNAIGTFGPQLRVKKGKKTKFADIVDKNFKDRKKGSTTYRVGEDRTTSLAPKVSLQAKATKEAWLQGRNGSNRKPFSSGFLK
jgi:hypothetical protein